MHGPTQNREGWEASSIGGGATELRKATAPALELRALAGRRLVPICPVRQHFRTARGEFGAASTKQETASASSRYQLLWEHGGGGWLPGDGRNDSAQGNSSFYSRGRRQLIAYWSQTMLNCIDNSGAAIVECALVVGQKRHASIGTEPPSPYVDLYARPSSDDACQR
jgi:hypothetical protein